MTQQETATHWAVVSWYGTNDLADMQFNEVLTGDGMHALYHLCRAWARCNLSSTAKSTVQYVGAGMTELRDNDPRRTIPLSTLHTMTPRQSAAFTEAIESLGLRDDGDHAACEQWCDEAAQMFHVKHSAGREESVG